MDSYMLYIYVCLDLEGFLIYRDFGSGVYLWWVCGPSFKDRQVAKVSRIWGPGPKALTQSASKQHQPLLQCSPRPSDLVVPIEPLWFPINLYSSRKELPASHDRYPTTQFADSKYYPNAVWCRRAGGVCCVLRGSWDLVTGIIKVATLICTYNRN